MIAYRSGARLTVCDGCFRPRRTGEDGWMEGERRMSYRSPDQVARDEESTGDGTARVDWCPECAPGAAVA